MSIVSDDENTFTQPPVVGSRRISARLAVPVVLGCAVLGSIVGVVHPLHPFFPSAHGDKGPVDLTLASAKLVENAPAAAQPSLSTGSSAQREQPESVAAGNASVSTGSVDRSPSPGASESAVAVASGRPDVAHSERSARLAGQSHRVARAKRLRRILWRRVRSKPPGSGVDAFFASLFPKI